MGRVIVIGVFLALAAVGCGGGDGQSETEKIRSVDEELSTLPDAGPGLGEASPPPELRAGWNTDFSKRSVSFDEFMSGGPGKDGIPAIDNPRFVAVEDVDFLEDREPAIELVLDGDARAYPIQILIWHEIVNDVVGGVPVAVTFCPLCNTAIAFDRRVDEQTLDFGTTGNLRNSDLVMYDRQTESWWQQFGGEALVGELTGAKLEQLPSRIVAWADFRREHAEGKVLSPETGFSRPYGENPYVGYDSVDSSPIFPTKNADDERLPPKERVVFIERGGEAVVVPFSTLREKRVVRIEVAAQSSSSGGGRGWRHRSTRPRSRADATRAPPRFARAGGSSPSTSRSGSRSPPSALTRGSFASPAPRPRAQRGSACGRGGSGSSPPQPRFRARRRPPRC